MFKIRKTKTTSLWKANKTGEKIGTSKCYLRSDTLFCKKQNIAKKL